MVVSFFSFNSCVESLGDFVSQLRCVGSTSPFSDIVPNSWVILYRTKFTVHIQPLHHHLMALWWVMDCPGNHVELIKKTSWLGCCTNQKDRQQRPKPFHFGKWWMVDQIMPPMPTKRTPAVFSMMPSSRFSRALIASYRKAQTSSCELSLASVSEMFAMIRSFGYRPMHSKEAS